ncbi:MAG: hypothetical protein JWQ96_1134 [Segetibacter sp.]|nr:hypothetical protein [Segetibacter sp.]
MKPTDALLVISIIFSNICFSQENASVTANERNRGFQKKRVFGMAVGAGSSTFKKTLSNWQQGSRNYHDSLKAIRSNSVFKFDISLLFMVNFNRTLAFRPTLTLSLVEGGNFQYDRMNTTETIKANRASTLLTLPLLFKLPRQKYQPYIGAGTSLLCFLGPYTDYDTRLPLKKLDVLGDIGIGVEFNVEKVAIFTPEIRYSAGLNNLKKEANNLYTNTIDKLKRRQWTFTLYMRDR